MQINTDSEFMIKCMNDWMPTWEKNGWRKSDGREPANLQDLKNLREEARGMDVKWVSGLLICKPLMIFNFNEKIYLFLFRQMMPMF